MEKTSRILLFITVIPLSLCAQSTLQQEVSFPKQSMEVKEILQEMQKQTDFHFSYGNTSLINKKVDLPALHMKVNDVLKKIKQETGLQYQVKGDKVILMPPFPKRTISGYLRDARNSENLIAGNIYIPGLQQGTTTNTYGYFSLTLPQDTIHLLASYSGYETWSSTFFLKNDTVININLTTQMLQEIVITGNQYEPEPIQNTTQMSTINLQAEQLKGLPAMAGEIDIMKSIQLLPGVSGGNEGTSGIYVRGGGPDQNLILLDGVPVYNVSHLFGFFSVFNADAINHVELIKGGFPARYGGRLSSVIDISMKEGNDQEIKGEGSIGIISSRLTLEGPIKKDKASFIISARRTYIDLLARPFLKQETGRDFGYYFYDLNAKLNYKVNRNNRIYLSAYTGKDKGFSEETSKQTSMFSPESIITTNRYDVKWNNVTSALRWNHVISPRLFANVSAMYSRYGFNAGTRYETFNDAIKESTYELLQSRYNSGIRDYSLKADFNFTPSPAHAIRFGAYETQHTFNPGAANFTSVDSTLSFNASRIQSQEFGAYAEDDITITPKLGLNAGIHFSGLNVQGRTFSSLQPRLSARYLINKNLSVKASYAEMTQFIHLLTNAGVGLPTDLWIPATPKVKPEKSTQIAGGFAYSPNKVFEITLEGYHKIMNNVVEYKDGASYLSSKNEWESKVEIGKGTSYGGELFVQKKTGRWTGWLGYTLSRTWREFENLNFGKRFPYRYDRRHDVEINVNGKLNQKISFSCTWVYGTGIAVSVPTAIYSGVSGYDAQYYFSEKENLYYEERNAFRLRSYHRMDLGLTFRKETKWGERSWVLGIYNLYNRQNPFYVDFEYTKNGKKLVQYSLFPIIPSISYNFKF